MAWASPEKQDPQPNALAAQFDIFKSYDSSVFTIGLAKDTGNRYNISVRINSLPYPALLTIRDVLPVGLTISDVQAIDWNCGIFNSRTELSCDYNGTPETYPSLGQAYPTILVYINVASSVGNQVTNKADLFIDGFFFSIFFTFRNKC